MAYKSKEAQREANRLKAQRHRAKAKGVTVGVTPVTTLVTPRNPESNPHGVTPSVTPVTPDVGAQIVNALRMANARLADLEAWRDQVEARRQPLSAPSVPPPSVSQVAASGRAPRRYPMVIKGNKVMVTEGQAYSCYGVQGIAPWLDADNQPMTE